jgi:hypothetical protein
VYFAKTPKEVELKWKALFKPPNRTKLRKYLQKE